MLPWLLCAALAVLVLLLALRMRLLQKSLDDIAGQLEERLSGDTNNPIFLSARDPHARKLASGLNAQLKELRAARRRFENGDKELKEAVTNVSHDLRTPLTAIRGYLELLERRASDPDTGRYLALITDRVDAMAHLTEELLRYSVGLSGEAEPARERVDLNAALEESVAGFYAAFTARGITPRVRLPEVRVVRQLSRAAVGRIFGNILSNALKYSGGDLEVELRRSGEILFSNTAPGLDEVQVGRLFDRFFSVEGGRGSTGLGLAIARSLTERQGGTIRAEYSGGRLELHLFFPENE